MYRLHDSSSLSEAHVSKVDLCCVWCVCCGVVCFGVCIVVYVFWCMRCGEGVVLCVLWCGVFWCVGVVLCCVSLSI